MRGLVHLAARHVADQPGTTAILSGCIALTLFLPAASSLLVSRYEEDLTARARATPLLSGKKGNRFDLTLAALYFRQATLDATSMAEVEEILDSGLGKPIPLNVRFTARRHPVVATPPEYFAFRGLRPAEGTLPLRIGDIVLGHAVANALEMGPGDKLFSDPTDLYDISKPAALRMHVAGVLAPTGTPDDDAVFTDLGTVWILEGLAHGHDDAESIDPSRILGRTDEHIALSPAVMPYQEVTDDNLDSFHFHGEPEDLPLTAILIVPNDTKAGTMIKARWNVSDTRQMLVPSDVIDDLLSFVLRIKRWFDAFAILLAVSTAALIALVVLLSVRLRRGELRTLHRMGCSPSATLQLITLELLLVIGLGSAVAMAGVAALSSINPQVLLSLAAGEDSL